MRNKLLTATFVIWSIVFIVLPLALVLVYGFTVETQSGFKFSVDNFIKFFTADEQVYLISLWRSLYLAFISTVICLLIGYPMAMILATSKSRFRNFFVTLFVLPMWMNFLMRTYAWLTLLENNGLINSLLVFFGFEKMELLYNQGAIVLGMVYNFLPFMVFPIYSTLVKSNQALTEAAEDLGANRFQVFRKITFPLSLPGVFSGISMVFMPAVTTFVISRLMGGGHTALIGDLIERQFLYSNDWHFASAISVIIILLILVTMALLPSDGEDKGANGLW